MELVGYVQPHVAHPGDQVEIKVSCTYPEFQVDVVNLVTSEQVTGPGLPSGKALPGHVQSIESGSYFVAPLTEPEAFPEGASVQLWVQLTLLGNASCLVAAYHPSGDGWELGLSAGGRLEFRTLSAAGEVTETIASDETLSAGRWYFVVGCWDARQQRIALTAVAHDARRPMGKRPVSLEWRGGRVDAPVISEISVGACSAGGRIQRPFTGKLESPRIFSAPLNESQVVSLAADAPASRIPSLRHEWRFSPAAALPPHDVPDHGPAPCPGYLVNLPTLAVTGHNWSKATVCFADAPEQYQAAHFHADALGDAGWGTDATVTVPSDLPSGVYGFRLRAGEAEDVVPLIVTPLSGRTTGGRPTVAVLLPTFSYLAYANEHASWARPIESSVDSFSVDDIGARDRYTVDKQLLSLYELHADGSGTCLSSWRRPVVNMRADYRMPLVKGPHQFSADMELLNWLTARDVDYDVITDDDVHCRGIAAMEHYGVVLTGSHPEYPTSRMLDALEQYKQRGGSLMYLGGNGFYWVTCAPEEDPYFIEVRRGQSGTRVWQSPPGEEYHAITGERGGLWRHRGRNPQELVGVGFTGQGFDRSLPYAWAIDTTDERAGWLLAGIDPAEPLGATGSVLGGAAGFEIDRYDVSLGSPEDATVIATAQGFSDVYQGAIEDVFTADSKQGGTASPLVRSDIVLFDTGYGGSVFSVGSIAWCGSLRDGDVETNAGRLVWNVLQRLVRNEPTKALSAECS